MADVELSEGQAVPMTSEEVQIISDVVLTTDAEKELKDLVSALEEELRVRTEERENFKNRMQEAEMQLVTQAKNETNADTAAHSNEQVTEQVRIEMERDENKQLREIIANLKIALKEKNTSYTCLDLQMKALETQVSALKEVATLTKGMLTIRNRENEKLKEQIDLTQKKIESERLRNNAVLKKTELASSLNAQLREEYLNQVKLFGELKGKYEKKINILTEEVARLNTEKEQETTGE